MAHASRLGQLFDVTYGSFTEKILPSKVNKFLHALNRNESFFNIKLGLSTFMSNLFSYLDLTKDLTLLSSLIYAAYRIFESFIGYEQSVIGVFAVSISAPLLLYGFFVAFSRDIGLVLGLRNKLSKWSHFLLSQLSIVFCFLLPVILILQKAEREKKQM